MAIALTTKTAEQVQTAAHKAGLTVVDGVESSGFNGMPTETFTLMLVADADRRDPEVQKKEQQLEGKRQTLELSSGFDFAKADLEKPVHDFLLQMSRRMRNPDPDLYVTLGGMPIRFASWKWPFHLSTSGADTYIVHGDARLEDGVTAADAALRAKISASMTVTFAEVVPAPEQPFAEGFIYNAVRKIMDQGQIELVKSGNRQPVPVTTRYYSAKQSRFVFNDTDEQQRQDFVATKVYWLSGALGHGAPVWIGDPRDAQYLNTTVAELVKSAQFLAGEGVLQLQQDSEFAAATKPLMTHSAQYQKQLAEALSFMRPTFNEEMRGGQTNM